MTACLDAAETARPDEAKLVQRRMTILGLDVGAWERFDPVILSELQGVCATCVSRRRCADDLAKHCDDPTWQGWRDYCANAARLEVLTALQFY
jgi:hypothetical protein